MVWVKHTLWALILLLLTGPAYAAVDCFTDEKGVIHITNLKLEKPAPPPENESVPASSPNLSPEAPAQEGEPSPPGDKQEAAKPSSYLTVRQGVIHIANVAGRKAEPARSPVTPNFPEITPGPKSPEPPLAVKPVALAAAAGPLVSFPSLPKPAPVRSYKDHRGVIHISNLPSPPVQRNIMVAGWSSTALGAVAGQSRGNGPLPRTAPAPAFPVTRVSLSDPAFQLNSPTASVRAAPFPGARACATVRRFRDKNGTLHIVGRGLMYSGQARALAGQPSAGASRLNPAAPFDLGAPSVAVRRDKQGRLLIRNTPPLLTAGTSKEELRWQLEPVVTEAAVLFGLPVSLIEAIIRVESNFQTTAVSPKGAMGLMQLMPGTARFLQVSNPFCPRENILGGCRYLRLLLDFFGQSLPLALAAYNAGFQRVLDAGYRVPDIEETRNFVTQVLAHYFAREKQCYALQGRLL